MSGGVITSLTGWAKQPFTTQMDVMGWALFTGLILVIVWFWSRVLKHVVE